MSEVPLYALRDPLNECALPGDMQPLVLLTSGLLPDSEKQSYRGTSITRERSPLGPYRRPIPRVPGGS